jgi:hypothetical protein
MSKKIVEHMTSFIWSGGWRHGASFRWWSLKVVCKICILNFWWNHITCTLVCVSMGFICLGHISNLQLASNDVYEVRIHVFIHSHTRSLQSKYAYWCLSLIINWWVESVMFIQGFGIWCIKETKFLNEESFDVDYKWFSWMGCLSNGAHMKN